MDIIIAIAVGIFIGRWIQTLIDQWAMKSLLKDLGVQDSELERVRRKIEQEQEQDSEPELTEISVKIEKIGTMLYAYELDNDQFLAQGRDREELLENLKHNLTNVRITVAKEHGADLIYSKD